MSRKLAGYMLLSFLSFSIFTTLFHTVANAESSPLIAAPTIFPQISPLPTPTIISTPKKAAPSSVKFTLQTVETPSPTAAPKQAEPTPTIFIAQPTKIPEPTAVPTVVPTTAPATVVEPTDTPVVKPTVAVAGDLDTLFTKYSDEYQVDKEDMKRIAKCEAGFNPQSDTGTYAGMFQFNASTWISTRNAMGLDSNPDLRKDAEESIRTAAFKIKNGGRGAWPNC